MQVAVAAVLHGWAREHGATVTAESGYILSERPATLRGPDVAVVVRSRSSEAAPGGWTRGAPDLAVEVLSPSDTSTAMQRKALDYFAAGARLVWVVDPTLRTVSVHHPDGSALLRHDTDTLEGDDVLPGFSVKVAELFD